MLGNWIKQTTTTTGTGALTMATVSEFPAFSSQFAAFERFAYAIIDDATGGPIERGIGYLDGSGNLVRERPMATFVSGTYTGANASAVSLAAGTKRVVCVEGAHTAFTSAPGVWAGANNPGYSDPSIVSGAASTLVTVAGRIYAFPFVAAVDADITAVKFNVINVAPSGSKAVIAIFSVGADGLPGVKLAESAQVAIDTAGIKTASFTRFRPPPRFFICLLADGVGGIRSLAGGINMAFAMGFDSLLLPFAYVYHDGASGFTFPSAGAWSPVGSLYNTNKPILVCVTA